MNINKIRNKFPWIKNNKKLIYFDNAATTLKPISVIKGIVQYYEKMGTNTHNLDSKFCFDVNQEIEKARTTIAKFFYTKADNICFTANATEGISLIAHGLAHYFNHSEYEILVNDLEHASNLLPWYHEKNDHQIKIKFVAKNKIPQEKDILAAITKKTKIIALSLASNVYGNIIDYKKIVKKIKTINPKIIIVFDATQFLPHKKVDVTCGVDFVVCSAHKLFGPTGIGAIYMSDYWIKNLLPLKYGGGMNETIERKYFTLQSNNKKFEGGTLPMAQIFGWMKAIKFIENIGMDNIFNYENKLKKYFIFKAKQNKKIKIYNPDTPLPIIIFNYESINAQDFANWLGSKGIICRSGLSCAKLVKNIFHVDSFVRCSLSIYNTKQEIDKFFQIIASYKKGNELMKILKK